MRKLLSKFSARISNEIISFDVAILYRIVKLTNRFFPRANENADWEGMLREFHATVFEEMDYVKEGRNADRFRYNFRTWRAIRVPKIYWSHTSRRVLTLEFIRGTKVTDVEGLRARRISAVKVNRLAGSHVSEAATRRRFFPRRSASGKFAGDGFRSSRVLRLWHGWPHYAANCSRR